MNLQIIPFLSFLILLIGLAGRIFYLRKIGIQTVSGNSEKNKTKRIFIPVFTLIFLIWLFEIIRPAFHIQFLLLPESVSIYLIQNKILQFSGEGLIVLGLILFVFTIKEFGSSLRFGLDKTNRGTLITSGIFSFSRNPFFLSLDVYFTGIALMLPSVFHIAFTLAAIIGIHFFILKEERFLAENYGDEYKEYQQKTRRYL